MFYRHVLHLLKKRGVTLESMADLVYDLQRPYHDRLTQKDCLESVDQVLKKREVQHAVITGVALDDLAEKGKLPIPLQQIMEVDEPLYGVDEILALSITNVYGTIGLTSFGYLDKTKQGVIQHLNNHNGRIHVFLDDLVAGIAAAASARIAHDHPDMERYRADLERHEKGTME
ncbi:phosphatidylglycerophosphatase A family protein [Paludifilum halophilum]|uniref:Phosphatidylglycerophosphatase A n=1 Tax=Paludifilum halophilum TaxID=1642702 RepID=A0A235B7X8_9BACL|nr:phosphatidylglycerophosphatase A [Paludifilum halophilum]OYD08418.1 phosphatidylglycerophosphatase A [Paludifilum halophilum]